MAGAYDASTSVPTGSHVDLVAFMSYRFLHHLYCNPFGYHSEAPPELAASYRYTIPFCTEYHFTMVNLHEQPVKRARIVTQLSLLTHCIKAPLGLLYR